MSDSSPRLPSFAVVIPMFNEESGAEKCVRAVCAELATIPNQSRLIIVEDGSSDRTAQILEKLVLEEPRLLLVRHDRNRGYGAALRTGAEKASAAGFEYVLFMDSDLTNHPKDIVRFTSVMQSGTDIIKATRYSKGGSVSGVPEYRVWISRTGNAIASILFGLPIRDCTNGFRAVKTSLLMNMVLTENRFPVIMEELYWSKFLARSFAEIPVTLTNRSDNLRPTSFSYRPAVFWNYLKYPLRAFTGANPVKAVLKEQK